MMMKFVVLVATAFLMTLPFQSSATAVTLYDFESGVQGWTYQDWIDSRGITAVAQSSLGAPAKVGSYSLEGTAHLIGGNHANYSKGETYVTLSSSMNLLGNPASVWVYAPTGLAGSSSAPNGWQMFFKDSGGRNWYGPWDNIFADEQNTWQQLTVNLGTTLPAHQDSGFDPTQVLVLGVKIGTAGASTSSYTYDGSLYVDEYAVVPEPTSLLLLGSGLVGLLGFATRRKI